MKGKHQRAKRRREAHATTEAVRRLRADIDTETQRATTARKRAGQTTAARARLAREQARNDTLLGAHVAHAGHRVAAAGPGWAAIDAALHELRAVDQQLSRYTGDHTIDQIAQAGVKFRLAEVHHSAAKPYLPTWYKKTTGGTLTTTRNVSLDGWVPAAAGCDKEKLAPYATSTVRDTTPQACYAWAIPPWLRSPADDTDAPALRALLGATTTGTPAESDRPMPGPPLRPDATITTPWRHAPRIPHPHDAVDLAYWYRVSAHAQGWHPDDNPVPFWLPPEQSVSYPQAQPLPEGTDIRLPFPVVLAVFAAPWEVHPGQPQPAEAVAAAQLLMLHARGTTQAGPEALHQVLVRLQATGLTDRHDLPTPLETIDSLGGLVEGLLLTANPDGTPRDEFAWCLTIHHPGGLPLGRITIPASRSRTAWRQEIDNTIAGIALSTWHQPADTNTPAPGENPDGNTEPSRTDLGVRVVDIDTTSPHQTTTNKREATSSPRPHLRRGHWRRLLTGPRRTQVRWTWVRATTVNTTHRTAGQVYVLPHTRGDNRAGRPTVINVGGCVRISGFPVPGRALTGLGAALAIAPNAPGSCEDTAQREPKRPASRHALSNQPPDAAGRHAERDVRPPSRSALHSGASAKPEQGTPRSAAVLQKSSEPIPAGRYAGRSVTVVR